MTYSDGIFRKTKDDFKLPGRHVVRVIGWENVKGNNSWIIENTWGKDWGQNGYGKIAFGETEIDEAALSFFLYPLPLSIL